MNAVDLKRLGRSALLAAALLAHGPAHAYIGPGAGLSAIGSVLALFGALLLMIVGFVWYPVKRLMKRRKAAAQAAEAAASAPGEMPATAPAHPESRAGTTPTQTDEP